MIIPPQSSGVARSLFAAALLLPIACASLLHATPDRVIHIDERLAGIGDGVHAILRTERDNMGSHYSDRENLWLDEYASGDAVRQLVKSTHLLDVTTIIDATHNDRNAPPPVERRVAHEDDSLTMASVLSRYPIRDFTPWADERMEALVSHPTNGIRFRNRVMLLTSKNIDQAFREQHAEHPWIIESIVNGGGCLYLRITKTTPDEATETRVFHVSPEKSQTVHDQLEMQPFYFVAGSYETLEEAVTAAGEFQGRAMEARLFGYHPEIWEERLPTKRSRYVIALKHSMHLIESGHLAKIREVLGVDLVPTSSKNFWKLTYVH